jgi:hypothetical protein|tara:strand:+ start:420 stop:620 length:201 start_codon:yes stop_codon:yes gene_type:complete
MNTIINYIFIGFILTFLLDYVSEKFKNHPEWVNVPDWNWGARILFTIAWPLGVIIFIYTLIKERIN